ncbi:hypothetical protein BDZ89DRAFT_1065995 [Hymenopellis radicata]|nr:hypothetical protein BDZ89DRAFT_153735 [Hymenopellis radicata]KAF9028712.1 hypothetical protein BDZ89DRAFT_1065995 [Hymenopellis radicata]
MRSTFIALALALVSQAAVVPSAAECLNLPAPLRPSTCPAEHRRDYYDSAGGNGDKVLWDNLKALRQTKREPRLGGNADEEMWKALQLYWATQTLPPFVRSAGF